MPKFRCHPLLQQSQLALTYPVPNGNPNFAVCFYICCYFVLFKVKLLQWFVTNSFECDNFVMKELKFSKFKIQHSSSSIRSSASSCNKFTEGVGDLPSLVSPPLFSLSPIFWNPNEHITIRSSNLAMNPQKFYSLY